MMSELPSFVQLLQQLQRIPFMPHKHVYRIGEYFLHMTPAQIEEFCASLLRASQNVVQCTNCFAWQEAQLHCSICTNDKRDQATVCVVETWQDLLMIEKSQGYKGSYHVLGGAIYPLEGIGPDDLTIKQLLERIERNQINELIFAHNTTPQGEATALYIAQKLKGKNIRLSCLARGLPVGVSLHDTDRITLHKALADRKPL